MTEYLLTIIDMAAFLAWVGIFIRPSAPDSAPAPYATALEKACRLVAAPFAQFRILPRCAASAAALAALAALHVIVAVRAGIAWPVIAIPFAAAAPAAAAGSRNIEALAAPAAFMLLSMCVSVFRIWTAWTVAVLFGAAKCGSRGLGVCAAAAAPFSRIPSAALSLPALAVAAVCLAAGILAVSPKTGVEPLLMETLNAALGGMQAPFPLPSAEPAMFAADATLPAKTAGCALLGGALVADGLGYAGRLAIGLVLLRFMARLFGNSAFAGFFGDILATMRGRLLSGPKRPGAIDWSPLLLWLVCAAAGAVAANAVLIAAGAAERIL